MLVAIVVVLDLIQKIGGAEGGAIGVAQGRLETVAGGELLFNQGDVLLPYFVSHWAAKGPRQERGEQSIGIGRRPKARNRPIAQRRIGAIGGLRFLAEQFALRRTNV